MIERNPQELPIESIAVRLQVRQHFDETEIAGLAVTIKQHGVHQPLLVYAEGEKFFLAAGERRLRAAQKAGLKSVPISVIPGPLSEAQLLEIQLIENLQRSDLRPLEKAAGIDRWIKASCANASEAALKLGLSNGTITKLLSLLSLPESIQAEVQAGKIGLTTAYKLSRIEDPQQQAELASRIAGRQLTRDGLTETLKQSARKPAAPSTNTKSVNRAVAVLGASRTVTMFGQELSYDTMIAWSDELSAKAKKARTQGLAFKTFLKVLRDQAKQEDGNA
jgi:ParB family transcriptional regulator, chromosome partitioning protein